MRPAPVFEGLLNAVRSRNGNHDDLSKGVPYTVEKETTKISSTSPSSSSSSSSRSIQIVEEAVGENGNDAVGDDDDNDDDIDADLKKEVAEAIIAALEVGKNDDLGATTFADNSYDQNDDDDDDDDEDDSDYNFNVPDNLKDKSLIGLSTLELDTNKGGDANLDSSLFVTIEYSKCCKSITSRAIKLQELLQDQGLVVEMNPYGPPSSGSFIVCIEVGTAGSIPLLELVGMERPFVELKALDMNDVTDRVLDSLDRKRK